MRLLSFCGLVIATYSCFSGKIHYPRIPGTIQVSDSFSIKATEITVYDYTSFVAANGFDTTLFPSATFLQKAPYKKVFIDLRNKTYDGFLTRRGKDPYFFFFQKVKGNRSEQRELKAWLDLPIGGISDANAKRYCNWLEDYYNHTINPRIKTHRYEIRLPTYEELTIGLNTKGVVKLQRTDTTKVYRFAAFLHEQ